MSSTLALSGRVAVVTGGTRGLGLATVEFLAGAGASVSLCSRDATEAERVAERVASTFGVDAAGFGVDVSSGRHVAQFATASRTAVGPASIIVNNAGILGPVGVLDHSAVDSWSHAIDVNIKGSAYMIAAFRDQLIAHPPARIVNLSGGGVGGPRPMERVSAYVTSKAAIAALTESAAIEFGGSDVTINAIAPGALSTGFLEGVVEAGPSVAGSELFDDAASRQATPTPESLAPYFRLLSYLLSPTSGWLTGRVLSARWDTDEVLDGWRDRGPGLNALRLRRIDDDLFGECHV